MKIPPRDLTWSRIGVAIGAAWLSFFVAIFLVMTFVRPSEESFTWWGVVYTVVLWSVFWFVLAFPRRRGPVEATQ